MKKLVRFYRLFLTDYQKYFIEAIIFNVFILLLTLPLPYFTKLYIDKIYPDKNFQLLWLLVLFTLGFQLFQSLIQVLYQYFTTFLLNQISSEIKIKFYKHLQRLEVFHLNQQKTGDLVSRMNEGPGTITRLFMIFNRTLLNVIYILVIPFILISINVKLFFIAILAYPANMILYYVLNKKLRILQKSNAEKFAHLNAATIEAISGVKNIQLLGQYDVFSQKLGAKIFDAHQSGVNVQIFSSWTSLFTSAIQFLGTSVFTFMGWYFVLQDNITMGTFFAFNGYWGYLLNPISQLFRTTSEMQSIFVAVDRFFEIYNLKTISHNGALNLQEIKKTIRFEKIQFGYHQKKRIFDGADIDIEIGKHSAIIGESGIGKTTLANLLVRSYPLNGGKIWLDGHSLDEINIESIRNLIGLFSQDYFLFSGSIKDNLTCFDDNPDYLRIEKILDLVLIEEFVKSLPDGLDTLIGENGSILSKGLKQRLLLARFLYFDKQVMIFDEMTNSLDIKTENRIFNNIKENYNDRTIIHITHKLQQAAHADRIIFIVNKNKIESGTHNELIKNQSTTYCQLYSKLQHAETISAK